MVNKKYLFFKVAADNGGPRNGFFQACSKRKSREILRAWSKNSAFKAL